MASAEEYFRSIPVVTKYYAVTAVATTVLVSFGVLNPYYLYLDFDLVLKHFQIWRLVTCFLFFGKFGFPWVFQMVLLVRYFRLLEETYFIGDKGTADFITLLTFGATVLLTISFFAELPFMGPAVVFLVMYVWSRKAPFADVVFYGFAFKAWHTPFLFLVLAILMGGMPVLDVLGIFVGHLYHFLIDIVPNTYGRTLIWTPEFLYRITQGQQAFQPIQPTWQRGPGYRMNQD